MKKGDKVICIKSYDINNRHIPLYIKDHCYTIKDKWFEYSYHNYFKTLPDGKKVLDYYTKTPCFWVKMTDGQRNFSLTKIEDINYFYEFFIPFKQIRKQKLLKLNEQY